MNLDALGLGEPAGALYQALLHRPGLLPEDAARRLGWDLGRLDAALAELLGHGLVTLTDAQRITVPDPSGALEPLIAARTEALEREARRIAAVRAGVRGLRRAWAHGSGRGAGTDVQPEGGGRGLIGRYAYPVHRELAVVHPPGPLARGHMAAALPRYRVLLRRGILLRKVTGREILGDADSVGYLSELASRGADIRLGRAPARHTVVVDGALALVCGEPGEPAAVTRDRERVRSLAAEFERIWRTSQPFGNPEELRQK
ncbi:hypothetical protein JK359_32045 [Streptomyces actinomycinicus]|uniref:Uncharacterized protein n=1 Tax=Streptomyces actinomycinicus TaxID=1695166 RepID=A0A937EQ79_9ACTN|nr:hypothetical protein [Streptomyces actinomycinicus]MBL1086537.1 hypothetical protein [Streptomyces actinomycinicus]